jgi:hypothetical protein
VRENMEWISVKDKLPKKAGWYAGALNPINHDNDNPKDSNEWRKQFGFYKVWFNPDSLGLFYLSFPGESKSIEVKNRITHWSELPEVPEL